MKLKPNKSEPPWLKFANPVAVNILYYNYIIKSFQERGNTV